MTPPLPLFLQPISHLFPLYSSLSTPPLRLSNAFHMVCMLPFLKCPVKSLYEAKQISVKTDNKHTIIYPSLPLPSAPDTALQLQRDVIFCQSAVSAVCTLAEQLLAALRAHFNNAGEYEEDCKDTSRKWLEQAAAIGVLLNFQTTLAPHVVSAGTVVEEYLDTLKNSQILLKITKYCKRTSIRMKRR